MEYLLLRLYFIKREESVCVNNYDYFVLLH